MGNPKGKPLSSIGGARSGRRSQLAKQAEIDTRNFGINKKPQSSVTFKPKATPKILKIPTEQCVYVLDTNVLMHDTTCLFRFEEHHIYLPMQVIQELDNNKKGHDEKNRNVREALRKIEEIILSTGITNPHEGIPLSSVSGGIASGHLILQTELVSLENTFEKADDKILAVVTSLIHKYKDRYKVVLVSKDINMRIKAHMKGIEVQDYRSDMVIEDSDRLYQGIQQLPSDFWDTQPKNIKSKPDGKNSIFEVSGPFAKGLNQNEFVYSVEGLKFEAQVVKKDSHSVTLRTVNDYTHQKNAVWGITARNREQNYALNLLLDPNVDLVTLSGLAGSGKTLLALAAALTQTLEGEKSYTEIIFTRATVPIGEEIGFLPGTEEEKMIPWMGAMEDNLDVLGCSPLHNEKSGESKTTLDWGKAATKDLIRSRLKVKSLSFMRGRTFLNKFLIIDEAQNLTPKQMKALITRAGPGTKIVCLGNLAQIDTPYLTEGSSGLTHLVDRFKGWKHCGHITLLAGERSRLASHANQVL